MPKLRRKSPPESENPKTNEKIQEDKKVTSWSVLWGGMGKCELPITEKQKIILSINKNEETGDTFLDVRTHVTSKKYTGLTSKGITVPLEKVGTFKEMLDSLIGDINLTAK